MTNNTEDWPTEALSWQPAWRLQVEPAWGVCPAVDSELARLPTEWIHHPWDAPVCFHAASRRISRARRGQSQAARSPVGNVAAGGSIKGHHHERWSVEPRKASEVPLIEMEVDRQPAQTTANVTVTARRRDDQMVPCSQNQRRSPAQHLPATSEIRIIGEKLLLSCSILSEASSSCRTGR